MTKTLTELKKLIEENKNFLIVSHINPEGDAIGSSIALALGLKKKGKSVYILNKDPVPDSLKFLPFSKLVSQKIPSREFDVIFIVDCATLERTGLKELKAKTTVVIDHHLSKNSKLPGLAPRSGAGETQNSKLEWIEPKASAVGELVYKLLNFLHVPIDKKIATNLYTSICTDTGGFRFFNTNSETLKIASELVKAGAEPSKITKEVYENLSFNRLRLLAQSLSTIEKKDKIAWITVTQNMFKDTKTSIQDTENLVNYPRMIKDIEVAVLFREDGKNSYKISFRSKGKVNVAKIARTFGGGGHANAAGCTLNGSLSEVKDKVLKVVRNAVKKSDYFDR
jgi:phosphoesterase RecJ-like protein